MILPALTPTYDKATDTLRLVSIIGCVTKEASLSPNIWASYTDAGELAEIRLLRIKTNSQEILQQALAAIGALGIADADTALFVAAATSILKCNAIPSLGALPKAHRADAGYFVEYLAREYLSKQHASDMVATILPHAPTWPGVKHGDKRADNWCASSLISRRADVLSLIRAVQSYKVHRALNPFEPFPVPEPAPALLDDAVVLLAPATGVSGDDKTVVLFPGQVGRIVESCGEDAVVVMFSDVAGVAYAIASIGRTQLMPLHYGERGEHRAWHESASASLALSMLPALREWEEIPDVGLERLDSAPAVTKRS